MTQDGQKISFIVKPYLQTTFYYLKLISEIEVQTHNKQYNDNLNILIGIVLPRNIIPFLEVRFTNGFFM